MGKCCSKSEVRHHHQETHEVLIDIDPGGVNMTGGTLVARSPTRWGASPSKPKIIPTSGVRGMKNPSVSRGPAGGTAFTSTYQFNSNGGPGYVGGISLPPTARVGYGGNNRSLFNITPASGGKRMGKTKTETTKRTYTKDGKRYEETVEVTTVEDNDGNVTKTTKTTTSVNDDAFNLKEMSDALDGAKNRRGRRKSSSSSSDSSPTRAKTSKDKKHDKPKSEHKPKSGLLSKIKGGHKHDDDDDSSDDEDFGKNVHKKVNEYRVQHGVSKLKFSKEMTRYAKVWAKKLAADGKMAHRPDSEYGENIFCLSSNSKTFKVKPDDVVDKWYSESQQHKFGEEPSESLLKSGHFTQMVWKDTEKLGVAKARCADGTKVFVVANFDPQGNWKGQFADQVPPLGGFPKSASSGKKSGLKSKPLKSSSSSDSESSSDEEDFAEDCLKSHNTYRKKHGAPPLKLSKKLNKFAKEWAETIAKKDVMQHRQSNGYGENLYVAWSSNPKHMIKGHEAVDSWYSEIKDFTFGREPSNLDAGHFTQVVWLDSKEVGVAYARSKSGKIYVVANYSPAGNFVGSFASKVPKLK